MRLVKQTVKLIIAGSSLPLFTMSMANAADMKNFNHKTQADCAQEIKSATMKEDDMMKPHSMK